MWYDYLAASLMLILIIRSRVVDANTLVRDVGRTFKSDTHVLPQYGPLVCLVSRVVKGNVYKHTPGFLGPVSHLLGRNL